MDHLKGQLHIIGLYKYKKKKRLNSLINKIDSFLMLKVDV